jgi:hypothetical protein
MNDLIEWLITCPEPWTRCRALTDLVGLPADDPAVQAARLEMLAHPQVQALLASAASWPGYALTRHNDARHPLYALSVLADFSLQAIDPGMSEISSTILAHQSPEGAFQSLVNIAPAFGGTGQDAWSWLSCDAPTLLYVLLSFGLGSDQRVQQAVDHLLSLGNENGWRCAAAPELGKFHGPGRRLDPCPVANLYALKALSLLPDLHDSPAVQNGIDMLLGHWEGGRGAKYFLFGVGSDYRKLKYPYIWYDLLHVAEALSRFPRLRQDPRFQDLLAALAAQTGLDGRYTAGSMYQAWKGWSFADKKNPSPWLTFLALRIQQRALL